MGLYKTYHYKSIIINLSFYLPENYDYDSFYTALFSRYPYLVEIKAQYLSDVALETMRSYSHLRSIDFSDLKTVTNESAENLAISSPSLTNLSLRARS